MSDVSEFSQRVEVCLSAARKEPHWKAEEANRYMAEYGQRRDKFEQLASRLADRIIRPRLMAVTMHFPNASVAENEPTGRCGSWFGYCEGFPVSAKVEFVVEHDPRWEKAVVVYTLHMMPVFIRFDEQDKLTMPLADVDERAVADWVEKRLLELLGDYLRIDRGGDDFDADTATDPVCGMRITRSSAADTADYRGHPYYFCSVDCQRRFTNDPTAYVQLKTM